MNKKQQNFLITTTFIIALFFLGKYVYEIYPRYEYKQSISTGYSWCYLDEDCYCDYIELEDYISVSEEEYDLLPEKERTTLWLSRGIGNFGYTSGYFELVKLKSKVCYTKKKVRINTK